MYVRQAIVKGGLAAIAASRADRWLARLARGRGVILMFHHVRPFFARGFAPNRFLEITPEFLDCVLRVSREEGFEPASLDDVPERLRADDAERPFVVVTFDDGYRDNVEFALPVLKRHGMPWTLFVTTGFADRSASPWWLELEEAVRRLGAVMTEIDGYTLSCRTETDAEKTRAFEAIYRRLRTLPEPELRAAVADLATQARVNGRAITDALCLNWDVLRQLATERDIGIGSHTLTHPRLARQDAVFAAQEVLMSRQIIERHIGRPVRHFAYPVGDAGSAGQREFRLARDAGYALAVTTRPGHAYPAHADHLMALPRVSINGLYQTESAVRSLLSGVPFMMWNRGRTLDVQ